MGPNKQNVSGMSYKIWKIARVGRRVRTQWGPATIDHSTRKVVPTRALQEFLSPSAFPSEAAARADEVRRVKEKLSEGYKPAPRRRRKLNEAEKRGKKEVVTLKGSSRRKEPKRSSPVRTRKAPSPRVRWTPTLEKLPALSLRQPWAWLVVNGYKNIENRSWPTRHRGPLLIHASATMTDLQPESFMVIQREYGVRLPDSYHVGRIIGVVDVVDCVATHSSKWKTRGSWGWVLKNPRQLPERDYKGSVGIFYPDFRKV